ncbi:MAG: hypothetical protein ABSG91_14240 [Syntrophobacteraceae bacterium]
MHDYVEPGGGAAAGISTLRGAGAGPLAIGALEPNPPDCAANTVAKISMEGGGNKISVSN